MNRLLCLAIVLINGVVGYRSETVESSSATTNGIRQNFAAACESMIEDQVLMELEASYFYLHFANYFQQYDVALLGFHEMFESASIEERQHAQLLIDYVYSRGGKVNLKAIGAPDASEAINTPIKIINEALNKEKAVNEALLKLHNCTSFDPHFQSFLEESLLNEQVDSIHDLGILLTRLRRCAIATHTLPICEHEIDRELQEEYAKKS